MIFGNCCRHLVHEGLSTRGVLICCIDDVGNIVRDVMHRLVTKSRLLRGSCRKFTDILGCLAEVRLEQLPSLIGRDLVVPFLKVAVELVGLTQNIVY